MAPACYRLSRIQRVRVCRQPIVVAGMLLSACLPYQVRDDRESPRAPVVAWARRFGDGTDQNVRGLAIDPEGNLVVAGDFVGVIPELGGLASAVDTLPFVAKLSPSGGLLWSRAIKGGGVLRVSEVAVSSKTGAVAVGGRFVGQIQVKGGAMTGSSIDRQDDGFVVLLDRNGELLWTFQAGAGGAQRVRAVAFFDDGGDDRRVAILGTFEEQLCLIGIGGVCQDASAPGSEGFLLTLKEQGTTSTLRTLAGPGEQYAAALAVDGRAGVIAGTNDGTIEFATQTLSTHGLSDLFLAKIDLFKLDDPTWSASFGNTEPNCYPECEVVTTVDGQRRTVVAGTVNGSLDVGGGEMFASPLSPDLFVAVYDGQPSGAAPALLWSRKIGGASDEIRPYGIASYGGGEIAVSGQFAGTLDSGVGAWTNDDVAHDAFALGFHAEGTLAWGLQLPISFAGEDPKPPPRVVVAADAAGAVYLAGSFRGAVRIGDSELRAAGSQGGYDFFIAKISPPTTP